MTAGLNIKIDVWTMGQADDDVVGGAVYTGTVSYHDVPARLILRRPSQILIEQGMETTKIGDLMIQGRDVTIQERDEIQIVWPLDHPFIDDRFRVEGAQNTGGGRRQAYGPKTYTVSRIERGRGRQ